MGCPDPCKLVYEDIMTKLGLHKDRYLKTVENRIIAIYKSQKKGSKLIFYILLHYIIFLNI